MVEFMMDSYLEYLGYIGRIHPEGTVPPYWVGWLTTGNLDVHTGITFGK